MKVVIHILRFKLLSFLNYSSEWTTENIIKRGASLIVFGGFALATFAASKIATDFLLDSARIGLFLFHRFLAMLLVVFFLSLNVGNIIVAYASLYRSPEVAFYLTKPISFRNLFVSKFMDSFFYSSFTFFLIAFAVLLGYGTHFHASWLFYTATMLLILVPFMFLAACAAVILLLVLMRFVDRIGVKSLIAILLVLYLGSLYGYFIVTNPVNLVSSVKWFYPRVDLYLGFLDPWFARFLPNYWIADGLYWMMRGYPVPLVQTAVLVLMLAVVSFLGMAALASGFFYPGWIASHNLRMGMLGSGRRGIALFSLVKRPRLEPQVSVMLKKEYWQFIREPSQWIHLGILALLMITFAVSLVQINLRQSLPLLQTISYMVVVIFNAFLIASISLRFVFPLVSVEGENFWAVLSAPVRREKVFWLKYLIALLPLLLLGEVLVLVSHRSLLVYSPLVGITSLSMVCLAIAMVSLNLGAGSYFADFKEKNPIRVASSQSATLTFLLSIAYIAVVVSFIFVPCNRYFAHILRGYSFSIQLMYYAGLEIILVSVVVAIASLAAGLRALRKDY